MTRPYYLFIRQSLILFSLLYLILFISPVLSQVHGGGSVTLSDDLNLALTKESLRHKLQTRKLSTEGTKEVTTVKTPIGTSHYLDGDLIGCGAIKIGENRARSIKNQTIVINGNILNLESGRRCRER